MNVNQRILRWICGAQRNTSTLMLSRFYSKRINYFEKPAPKPDPVDAELQNHKVHYREAIENDFPSGLQIKAYNTVNIYKSTNSQMCELSHKSHIYFFIGRLPF